MKDPQQIGSLIEWGIQPRQQNRIYSIYYSCPCHQYSFTGGASLILEVYEKRNNINKEQLARKAFDTIIEREYNDFINRMPEDKKGYDVKIGDITFTFAIRRLTPQETAKLQGIPDWYKWDGISESQQYKMHGNGWQCDTIEHCWQFLPEDLDHLNVWSLFDGMACAHVALNELGKHVDTYVSSEIDKSAIQVEKLNFPDMHQVGSVTDINVKELVEKYGVPDMLVGGPPCQSFSFSGKMQGMATEQGEEIYTLDRYMELKWQGFQFSGQSYLFWEYMRILTELRQYNPNIIFFLENVEMLEKWERCLSHAIGVCGVHINSALVSAQQRKRIYWSNIRVRDLGSMSLFEEMNDDPFEWPRYQTDIPQPEDRGIVIKDIMQKVADQKYYLKSAMVEKLTENTDKGKLRQYLVEPQATVSEVADVIRELAPDLTEEEVRETADLAMEMERKRLRESVEQVKELF